MTNAAIGKALGLSKDTAWHRVQRAVSLGYVVNLETRKGRPAKLVPGDPLPEERPALPPPHVLQPPEDKGERITPPKTASTVQPVGTGPIRPESEGAVEKSGSTDRSTVQPFNPSLNLPKSAASDSPSAPEPAAVEQLNADPKDRGHTRTCPHRPPGEVGDRWAHGDRGGDPAVCRCCEGPVRLGPEGQPWDGLCNVCRAGQAYRENGGHLTRLSLDLGARMLEKSPNGG